MVKLPFNLNLGSKKLPGEFLAIDIGSKSIKVLAYEHLPTGELKIVGIGSETTPPNSIRAGNIIEVESVAEALDDAIFQATDRLENDVNSAIFGVGGAQCTCLTTTVKVTRGTTAEITQKELNNINQKIIIAAYESAYETLARSAGDTETELKPITTYTIYSVLDGKLTPNLLGQTGSKLEIATFTAFAPNYHLAALQKICSLLKLNNLAIASNMYALTKSLNLQDAVVIDIGGDTTDVGVVFGGGVVASKVLNIGGMHFTRQLSNATGLTINDAEQKKLDFSLGSLQDNHTLLVENCLADVSKIWLNGLSLLFAEFDGVKTFASDLFLLGGASKLQLIMQGLENEPWTKAIPFKEPPTFSKISLDNMKHLHDATGNANQPEFVNALALAVIYKEMLAVYD